ncbi:MAG: glycine betaine/L-proline ABC transporter ATP-binding protein [Deltaproteobacteria bacterium]|nr:glycine betaine/L-proline ABC transporter ATP-binding protein [Deltaproteobacteria bacterium]
MGKILNTQKEQTLSGPECLEVKNLWKIFGPKAKNLLKSDLRNVPKEEILEKTGCVLALRDISFRIEPGEFFVIMGLSGSGKSTLIRCILRLIEPTAGSIIIHGDDICKYDKEKLTHMRRYTTSMVFQHFGLLPHYNVLDNAAYGLKVRGMSKEERYAKAEQALETVGLKGWESYYPGSLSGGMQQRVGLARSLATDPEILIMDEPFSGLDPLIRRQMQDELVEIQEKVKKTIIFVTHDLYEALKLGSHIAIMRNGEVIQIGTPEEVFTEPADDYVRDFVQEASPAKVLTAGKIMKEPGVLLYEWQGPKAARHMINVSEHDYAFVVTKHHELLGIATFDGMNALIRKGSGSIREALVTDLPTCGPNTLLEDLFPLAPLSPYPLAVTDEKGKFLGQIRNRTIIESMIRDREEVVND